MKLWRSHNERFALALIKHLETMARAGCPAEEIHRVAQQFSEMFETKTRRRLL
tara:strand:- start:47 stop:205 length:159 start_codon:yes stop_codon:yes gene_type:complete